MASTDYRFINRWRVTGTAEEIYRVLDDSQGYVRWWPSVWLKAEVLEPGDERGIGKVIRYDSKGWLPYLLNWSSKTKEKQYPTKLAFQALGDFDGEGCWLIKKNGTEVDIEHQWTIQTNKPILRYLSFLFKPLFAANHRWAMARGEESLKLELARQHATTDKERASLPTPPQATFMSEARRKALGFSLQ
ncbi:MAG: polyketide cyclase [Gemmatales bacterium]